MSRGSLRLRPLLLTAAAVGVFAFLVTRQDWWVAALRTLFPRQPEVAFPSATVAELTLQHLRIVGISSALTLLIGIPLGVWVTRPSGRDFRELTAAAVDFGQTFPPVAVLALAMPLLGLGFWPAILALWLYGLFPVVSNTVAGLDAVPSSVLEAARGMGMGRWRILVGVELPLAARVIMAGIRNSVIINIGTATVAAAVGAGGLGDPIIGGINTQNMAYVLQGAVTAALLAVLADALMARVEEAVTPQADAAA
jgi:osmoprotectant transport system permease protein